MGCNIFTIEAPNGAELSLRVDYTTRVYGSYHPATMESPEEYPEVEVEVENAASLRLPDGRWINYHLSRLPRATYEALMGKVEQYAVSNMETCHDDYDNDPDNYDDYDDPRSYNVDCSTDSYGRNILP